METENRTANSVFLGEEKRSGTATPRTNRITIVLETIYSEVGHADDDQLVAKGALSMLTEKIRLPPTPVAEQDEEAMTKQLPMVVFRAIKTFEVDGARAAGIPAEAEASTDGIKLYTFPSKRLMDGFGQVLTRMMDSNSVVDVSKPDVLSVLTAAIMLKSDDIIVACSKAIHEERLPVAEFPRALKLVKKFGQYASFVDAIFLFGLRHARQIAASYPVLGDWDSDMVFDQSAVRIKTRFIHLFNPVIKVDPTESEDPTTKRKAKSYPHLEKHKFERIVVDASEEHHFILTRERDNAFLCAARLNDSKDGFLFFSADKYPCDMKAANNQFYCGTVEANFLGDVWVLFDSAGKLRRMACGQIKYEQNALGRVPNAMTVQLPEGFDFKTKKPRWSEEKGYSLDFRGRVIIASKKNFLLLNSGTDDGPEDSIVMLFGKVSKHLFSLDIARPMNPVLAFAVALTTFADKLIVT